MSVLVICIIAFSVVIITLGIMAAVMRLIAMIFPERDVETVNTVEPILAGAISQAVSGVFPGARVTIIEEITNRAKR